MAKKIGLLMNGYVLRESPTLYYLCECLKEEGFSVEIFMNVHEPLDAETYQKIGVPIISPERQDAVSVSSVLQQSSLKKPCVVRWYRRCLTGLAACLPKRMRFAFFSWYYRLLSPSRSYVAFLRQRDWDEFDLLFIVEPEGLDSYHHAKISVPYIYLSMELNNLSFEKTSPGERYLKMIEQRYVPQACFSIIQDAVRERIFREDTGLPDSHPIIHLPVSIRGNIHTNKTRYFQEKFRIPAEKRIVLYAGSLAPWSELLRLIPAVAAWDEKFVLVIHGGRIDLSYLAQLQTAAKDSPRIFFSTDWMPYDQLDALISSADIGIFSYNEDSLNTRLTLHASGKLAAYLKSGLPLVSKNFEGMSQFYQQTGCGKAFDVYEEIADALLAIDTNYEWYRTNAFRTFQEQYCFDTYFKDALSSIQQAISIPSGSEPG